MEKRISYSQFQQIKSAAKMMDPNVRKIETLTKKIIPLAEEIKTIKELNSALEEGIVKTFGFHVSDLVKKVIEPTGTMGKDGKPIKVTKYLPTDIVTYDDQKKEFVVTIPDDETHIVPPTTENVAGSDYDKDVKESSEASSDNDLSWSEGE